MSYILYVPGRETVRPECFKSGKEERIRWEKEDHARWSSGLGVEFFPVWNRSQSDVLLSSHKTAEGGILEDELSMRTDAARRRQRAFLALQF